MELAVHFLFITLAGLFSLSVFLLPSLVAYHRKHHQRLAILMANLFLGPTGLGWVAALIWACTAVKNPQTC